MTDKHMLNQIILNSYSDLKLLPESSDNYDIYMHIFEELCHSKS